MSSTKLQQGNYAQTALSNADAPNFADVALSGTHQLCDPSLSETLPNLHGLSRVARDLMPWHSSRWIEGSPSWTSFALSLVGEGSPRPHFKKAPRRTDATRSRPPLLQAASIVHKNACHNMSLRKRSQPETRCTSVLAVKMPYERHLSDPVC